MAFSDKSRFHFIALTAELESTNDVMHLYLAAGQIWKGKRYGVGGHHLH